MVDAARPTRACARRLRLLLLILACAYTCDVQTVAVLVAAVVEVAEGVPTAQVACQSSGTSRSSRGGTSTNSTITSNHFARRHCKQLSDKHNVPKVGWDPSRSARLVIFELFCDVFVVHTWQRQPGTHVLLKGAEKTHTCRLNFIKQQEA